MGIRLAAKNFLVHPHAPPPPLRFRCLSLGLPGRERRGGEGEAGGKKAVVDRQGGQPGPTFSFARGGGRGAKTGRVGFLGFFVSIFFVFSPRVGHGTPHQIWGDTNELRV